MSEETIKTPHTSEITFSPDLIDNIGRFIRVKFKGIYLKKTVYLFFIKK